MAFRGITSHVDFMSTERHLRRKITLKAHGRRVVFIKRKHERMAHVWMKAFLWALYLPEYPDLSVEISIGARYKPDVVSLDPRNGPVFWGEAGVVSFDKIRDLVQRYPRTHFAMAKWNTVLDPFVEIVAEARSNHRTFAPFDLISIPADAGERFIDSKGRIQISFGDVNYERLPRANQ